MIGERGPGRGGGGKRGKTEERGDIESEKRGEIEW